MQLEKVLNADAIFQKGIVLHCIFHRFLLFFGLLNLVYRIGDDCGLVCFSFELSEHCIQAIVIGIFILLLEVVLLVLKSNVKIFVLETLIVFTLFFLHVFYVRFCHFVVLGLDPYLRNKINLSLYFQMSANVYLQP